MELPLYTVDAFTSTPFAGNQAGVCIFDTGFPDDSLLQKIAMEMNIAETAFVTPFKSPNEFQLRWFTPSTEVPLCGHATLATAYILYNETSYSSQSTLIFHTLSGPLVVHKVENSKKLKMDFPQGKPVKVHLSQETIQKLVKKLSIPKEDDIIDIYFCASRKKLLVEVKNYEILKNVQPSDLMEITFGDHDVKGIIVSCSGGTDTTKYDFCSRYFAPWVGIPEDPVTGSAHCVLAPYWKSKLQKNEMVAFQASKRGGVMGVKLVEPDRVLLEGDAVVILKAKLYLP